MKSQFNEMLDEQISKIRSYEERVTKAKLNYSKALQRLEEISDEIHHKRKANNSVVLECRGVGVGAESPIPPSPKLTKALRKLSLESSQNLTQMPINWFYKSGAKSVTNSERDDCESVTDSLADSVDTNDTLDIDDTVIDNLMLAQNIDLQFNSISDSDKTTIL